MDLFIVLAVNCQLSGLHVSKNALYEHTQCRSAFACHVFCYAPAWASDNQYALCIPICISMWSSMGSVVVSYVQFRLFWVLLLPQYVSFHIVAHTICECINSPWSYQCPFTLVQSWSLRCFCRIQVSITLNEFHCMILYVNLLSFHFIPGFVFGLSYGLVSSHLL